MNSKAALGLTAGAVVVGLLAGLALGGGDDKASKTKGPGPTKTVAGVPVGYERSRDGAASAALNYEAALLKAGLRDNAKVLEVLSDRDQTNDIASAMKPGLELVAQRLGDGAILRSSALGYRVTAFDPDSAAVEIWEVGILGSGESAPEAGWTTTTLRLRWTDNDWKLAEAPESRGGPTPQQPREASDPAALLDFARSLGEIDDVPSR